MKYFITITLFITYTFACNVSKKITPSVIGFTTLHNYLLNPDVSFQDTVHYVFVGNAIDFHKIFYLTKGSPRTATVPDFAFQSVVAIILKPTEKVVSIDINKALIAGDNLNIWYTITDTTSWKNYAHTPMVVATVPKNISIKKVSFYSDGIKEKTIPANY